MIRRKAEEVFMKELNSKGKRIIAAAAALVIGAGTVFGIGTAVRKTTASSVPVISVSSVVAYAGPLASTTQSAARNTTMHLRVIVSTSSIYGSEASDRPRSGTGAYLCLRISHQ